MAALTQDQVVQVYTEQGARCRTLFEVKDITAGDTVDLSVATGFGNFRVIEQAAWVIVTGPGGVTSATISRPGTITVPASATHDAAYLLVDGVAS
jgi:hypothetical protein